MTQTTLVPFLLFIQQEIRLVSFVCQLLQGQCNNDYDNAILRRIEVVWPD
jgi:hypothetical protein